MPDITHECIKSIFYHIYKCPCARAYVWIYVYVCVCVCVCFHPYYYCSFSSLISFFLLLTLTPFPLKYFSLYIFFSFSLLFPFPISLSSSSSFPSCITRSARLDPASFPRWSLLPPANWWLSAGRFVPSPGLPRVCVPLLQRSEDWLSSVLERWIELCRNRATNGKRTLPLSKIQITERN